MLWNRVRGAGMLIILTLLLAACSNELEADDSEKITTESAKQFIAAFINKKVITNDYYYEAAWQIDDEQLTMHEWLHDKQKKIIKQTELYKQTTIIDNNHITTYEEGGNQAYAMQATDAMLEEIEQQSLTPLSKTIAKTIKDTHEFAFASEDEVLKRETYHILATPSEANNANFGKVELWIDKKTLLTLKMTVIKNAMENHYALTKLQLDKPIKDKEFTLELPQDVTVVDAKEKNITLQQAEKKLQQSFLYVKPNHTYQLVDNSFDNLNGKDGVYLTYTKNYEPFVELAILKEGAAEVPAKNTMIIRGQKGNYIEVGELGFLNWAENGLHYVIATNHKGVTRDDLLAFAELMQLHK